MLENINFEKINTQLKICKNKFKKAVFTAGLSVLISTSFIGCNSKNESTNTDEASIEETTDSIEESIESETNVNKEDNIIEENKLYKEYIDYFEEYSISYSFEEYFLTPEEINQILNTYTYDSECNYINTQDASEIYDTVKRNSFEYVKENPKYQSTFVEEGYNISDNYDQGLVLDQMYFEIYFELILKKLMENSTNDLNEDLHKMQTLKFVYGDTDDEGLHEDEVVLGCYEPEENLIILSRDDIKLVATSEQTEFEYVLYDAITHELNHVRQQKCDCRIYEENIRIDISYNKDFVSTLIESSAESEIYNLKRNLPYIEKTSKDYSYIDERKDEALLLLLALFNENATLEDYYNAIYDTDMPALMNFFDLKTDEEKYTFFNLLYIIDSLNGRCDLAFKIYSENEIDEGVTLGTFKKDIGYGYKSEIFKICLNRLTKYTIEHKDFDLEDNLLILNLIKNKIVDDSYSIEKITYGLDAFDYDNVYDETFIKEVLDLENKYIEFLSEYYLTSIEDIRNLEENETKYQVTAATAVATDTSYTIDDTSSKILTRFPVLKALLYSNWYNLNEYKYFLEEDEVKKLKYENNY